MQSLPKNKGIRKNYQKLDGSKTTAYQSCRAPWTNLNNWYCFSAKLHTELNLYFFVGKQWKFDFIFLPCHFSKHLHRERECPSDNGSPLTTHCHASLAANCIPNAHSPREKSESKNHMQLISSVESDSLLEMLILKSGTYLLSYFVFCFCSFDVQYSERVDLYTCGAMRSYLVGDLFCSSYRLFDLDR